MTIETYTADDLHLLAGDQIELGDWQGPVVGLPSVLGTRTGANHSTIGWSEVCYSEAIGWRSSPDSSIRLDARRPEVAHLIRDRLGQCMDYTRDLPAWQAAVILAESARRATAGMEPIVRMEVWPYYPVSQEMLEATFGETIQRRGRAVYIGEIRALFLPCHDGRIARVEAPDAR